MNQEKTAAAYIRVSTGSQTELSPDSQIKVVRTYAEQHGYRLPEPLIFRDDGISGRRADKRPAFNRMIAAAKQKPAPFCAVLLWKFSRFARNQEESIFTSPCCAGTAWRCAAFRSRWRRDRSAR